MAENNYDLEYTGSMVDRILDTGYDLQNQGYIFRGLASHYTGTPTERTWLIAPTGSTGFGLSSPVPPGSIGICMYNGSSWLAEVLNTLTLDTAPTAGSGNGITSAAVKTLAESITNAIGQLEQSVSDRFTSLTLEDTTGSLQAELLSITMKYVFEGETESLTSISILAATAEKAGLMSAADKQKLDAFITNIRSLRIQDTTAQADQGTEITNTLKWTIGGVTEAITAFTLYAATTSKAGLMSAADKTALDTLPSLINAGYLYAGIATPSTVPSSTSAKIFYLAIEGGTYTGFNLNVTQGINIIYKSGDAWSVAQVVGIDNEPTAGSDNLVKSGGVKTELALGAVYDVSAHNNGATFESLSALLSDTDLNALIPTAVRKGGMSIKFVQSSDNKYVQYRYTSTAVIGNPNPFLDINNWQKIVTTKELVFRNLQVCSLSNLFSKDYIRLGKSIQTDGSVENFTQEPYYTTLYYSVPKNCTKITVIPYNIGSGPLKVRMCKEPSDSSDGIAVVGNMFSKTEFNPSQYADEYPYICFGIGRCKSNESVDFSHCSINFYSSDEQGLLENISDIESNISDLEGDIDESAKKKYLLTLDTVGGNNIFDKTYVRVNKSISSLSPYNVIDFQYDTENYILSGYYRIPSQCQKIKYSGLHIVTFGAMRFSKEPTDTSDAVIVGLSSSGEITIPTGGYNYVCFTVWRQPIQTEIDLSTVNVIFGDLALQTLDLLNRELMTKYLLTLDTVGGNNIFDESYIRVNKSISSLSPYNVIDFVFASETYITTKYYKVPSNCKAVTYSGLKISGTGAIRFSKKPTDNSEAVITYIGTAGSVAVPQGYGYMCMCIYRQPEEEEIDLSTVYVSFGEVDFEEINSAMSFTNEIEEVTDIEKWNLAEKEGVVINERCWVNSEGEIVTANNQYMVELDINPEETYYIFDKETVGDGSADGYNGGNSFRSIIYYDENGQRLGYHSGYTRSPIVTPANCKKLAFSCLYINNTNIKNEFWITQRAKNEHYDLVSFTREENIKRLNAELLDQESVFNKNNVRYGHSISSTTGAIIEYTDNEIVLTEYIELPDKWDSIDYSGIVYKSFISARFSQTTNDSEECPFIGILGSGTIQKTQQIQSAKYVVFTVFRGDTGETPQIDDVSIKIKLGDTLASRVNNLEEATTQLDERVALLEGINGYEHNLFSHIGIAPRKPCVMFTMDISNGAFSGDNLEQYEQLLKTYGVKNSCYNALPSVLSGNSGYLNRTLALQSHGNEIALHTDSQYDLAHDTLTIDEFKAAVADYFNQMGAMGFYPVNWISLNGSLNSKYFETLKKYVCCAQTSSNISGGISSDFNQGINTLSTDRCNYKRINLEFTPEAHTPENVAIMVQKAKDVIDQCIADGGYIVFYSHSYNVSTISYTLWEDTLLPILQYLKTKLDAYECISGNISDVLNYYYKAL